MGAQKNTGFKAQVAAVVVGGLVLAAGLVVLGAQLNGYNQIGIEIVKAGLQLGVIAIVGGGVAAALKYLDSLRAEQRSINEYRLNVLRDVTISYNQIKGVRRVLRSLGFNSVTGSALAVDQVIEFRAQMKCLNEAQLTLERAKREVKVRSDAFPKGVSDLLREAENYVREVLRDWEKHSVKIMADASREVLDPMVNLRKFLESAEKGFEEGIGSKMKLIQKEISALVFGQQSSHRDERNAAQNESKADHANA